MNQDLQDENDLIRRAASAQDQLALSKLLVKYQPLIMSAAHDWHYRELGEEAQSVAQLYFMDAVNTFDTARGVPFKRRQQREVQPDGMAGHEGEEDAPAPWDAVFLASRGNTPSGSAELGGLGEHMDSYEQAELRQEVEEALRNLTQRERDVVREIYFRDCPAYAAAQKLRLSPGRVSRIRQSALRKMRGFMDR